MKWKYVHEIWNVRYVGWLCLKPPLYPRLMAQKPMPSTNANYFVKAPHSKEKHCVKHMILTRDASDTILFGVTKYFLCLVVFDKCLFTPWPFCSSENSDKSSHVVFPLQRSQVSLNKTPNQEWTYLSGGVGISLTTTNHPDVYMYKYWNWNSKTLKLEIP